jgi:hypothetical protein
VEADPELQPTVIWETLIGSDNGRLSFESTFDGINS